MARDKYKNPEAKNVNQKQGPRTGNTGDSAKRTTFIKEKSGEWREAIANRIMTALEGRGTGMKPYIDPAVEGLHADTGPKRNPTAGGTKYNVRTKAPAPRPARK
jgi:hypothetical protein